MLSACQKGGGVPNSLEARDANRCLGDSTEIQAMAVTVLNSSGRPVPGVKIFFESDDGAVTFPYEKTISSDENGYAEAVVKIAPTPGTHHAKAGFRLPDGTT